MPCFTLENGHYLGVQEAQHMLMHGTIVSMASKNGLVQEDKTSTIRMLMKISTGVMTLLCIVDARMPKICFQKLHLLILECMKTTRTPLDSLVKATYSKLVKAM